MKEKITLGFISILILFMLLIQLDPVTAFQIVGKQQNFNMPEEDLTITIEQGVEKFFEVEGEKSLLQQKIVVSANQNNLKRESERLQIEVPKIQDKNPILAILLVNGDKAEEQVYHYDEKMGKLEVQLGEENQNASNTFKVIYGYEQINMEQSQKITLNTTCYTKIENKEEIQTNDTQDVEISKMGEKVSEEGTITKETYKGYLYEAKGNDTIYEENDYVEVSNMQNVEELKIEREEPQYTYYTGENQENRIVMPVQNNVYFQKTWISQENMKKVLGEEGKITIQNQNNEVIAEINKDTRCG